MDEDKSNTRGVREEDMAVQFPQGTSRHHTAQIPQGTLSHTFQVNIKKTPNPNKNQPLPCTIVTDLELIRFV